MTSLIWPTTALPLVARFPSLFDEIFNIGLQPVSNYGINRGALDDGEAKYRGSRQQSGLQIATT